jgi:cobalt-zinc-cadmium efflux system protein
VERSERQGTEARLVADLHRHAPRARPLAIVLAMLVAFTVVEVVGGVLTDSLALLADAGHMLADDASLALALAAMWIARKPPTPERSFGYRRAEILAALANGVALVAIAIWIFVEGARRLAAPPDVLGGWMLVVASAGLAVNVVAAVVLGRAERGNLNLQAAFRHVLADLLGSVGAIVAALVILLTGWLYADPLIGMAIGVLILVGSWSILRDSVSILLEGAPRDMDARGVGRALSGAPGVVEVHDLHIWEIGSGFPALSAHVLVGREEDCHARRRELERLLQDGFGIVHTTLQVDHALERDGLLSIEPLGRRDAGGSSS